MKVPPEHMVIYIDGVCNLCNGIVQFVIKRDKNHLFKFSQLQSPYAKRTLSTPYLNLNTVVFRKGQVIKTKSAAILEILLELPGIWKLTYILKIFPTTILDFIYDWVAKNRYKWFGKSQECWIPTPELNEKFLFE